MPRDCETMDKSSRVVRQRGSTFRYRNIMAGGAGDCRWQLMRLPHQFFKNQIRDLCEQATLSISARNNFVCEGLDSAG
jgi:hypothetical protein